VLVGAAVNFSATVKRAQAAFEEAGELHILCAGRERIFALEDAFAAGRFARGILGERDPASLELNDAAVAALDLDYRYNGRWRRPVTGSAASRHLQELGFKDDVAAACRIDRFDLVATYHDRHVTAQNRP